MSVKAYLYALVTILVIFAMDGVNINAIFKKNQVFKARLVYFFLCLSISYLVTNFLYDIFEATKIYY